MRVAGGGVPCAVGRGGVGSCTGVRLSWGRVPGGAGRGLPGVPGMRWLVVLAGVAARGGVVLCVRSGVGFRARWAVAVR
ncbi:Hypothetical protein SCLAV_1542 [Streptomyces clavuligerus]|uniref:Uncharacterized protein n=1 Tax=Streptomyces clavuligerus TaxID=1901 RepID=E2Q1Z1_STRCL|nr:Hypothetical protein SCLAV_1542 [Streptomyces clavuligerus]